MAKTKSKNRSTQYSKSKTSIFLCCFGSHMPEKAASTESITVKGSDPNSAPKQKRTSWFSWGRIRINTKSTSKTVPLEASFSVKAHYSKFRSKYYKSQAPATSHSTPAQPAPVLSATPYYTPSQTRHGASNNNAEDTREQSRATPTRAKRQARRVSSSVPNETTSKKHRNERGSYDPVVGMSVLVVTLVIMIFCGRLCAILCTSGWLYFIPRFRKSAAVNDDEDLKTKLNDVDLDSEVYKKRVIMEGLLGRNHRGIV